MTENHPITPPPELVMDWCRQRLVSCDPAPIHHYIATQAARWGADQELDACCEWLVEEGAWPEEVADLRAAWRPKPPSLKEQALDELHLSLVYEKGYLKEGAADTIRRALEQLDD